jgi:hypothetical protein
MKKPTPYNLVKAQISLEYITDVLSGDEGGIPFLKFKMFVDALGGRADNGDKSAEQVLEVVYRFEKMIRVAQRAK